MTSEANPLFAVYLSLLRVCASRQLPELVACWQLAPALIRDALPFREVLTQLQQQVEDLKIDAYCLLSDPHFYAAVSFLKEPPLTPMVDKDGNRVAVNPETPEFTPYTQLQVTAQPQDWLIAKLRIPLKLHSYSSGIVTEEDQDREQFTVYRSALSLTLGEIEVGLNIDTYHRYQTTTYAFDLKRQQEEIFRQLSVALQGIESQLIEEVSCLCCYSLQIFALTERLQIFHRRFQERQKNKDTKEM